MRVTHDTGRTGFLDALGALRAAADSLDDEQLLLSSRCRGWTTGDVLVHVHLGLQEMLLAVVTPAARDADTDAARYWGAPQAGDADPVARARVRAVAAGGERVSAAPRSRWWTASSRAQMARKSPVRML